MVHGHNAHDTTPYICSIPPSPHSLVLTFCIHNKCLLLTFKLRGTLHSFIVGNITSRSFCRHMYKCLRIFDWSKVNFPGGILFARAVAKATANRAQSQPPACICTSMIFNLIAFSFVHKIEATCFLVYVPTDGYILSYTHTSAPSSAPTVLIVSQCPWPSCKICINSSDRISNPHVWLRQGGWNPPTKGFCFFSSDWAAHNYDPVVEPRCWMEEDLSVILRELILICLFPYIWWSSWSLFFSGQVNACCHSWLFWNGLSPKY